MKTQSVGLWMMLVWLSVMPMTETVADEPKLKLDRPAIPEPLEQTVKLVFDERPTVKDIVVTKFDWEPKDGAKAAVVKKDLSQRTFVVQFFDIRKAGQYKATFNVKAELNDGSSTQEVPGVVEVAIGQPPKFDILSKDISLAIAACGTSCPLSRLLAPEIGKVAATVEVKNQSPYNILVEPSFQPQGSGPLDWDSRVGISPSGRQQIEPLQSKRFTVQVANAASGVGDWAAGKYEGKIVFAANQVGVPRVFSLQDGQVGLVSEAVRELSFVAKVRDSVWLAVLVAFAGVVLGRFLQAISTDVYRQRMALMVRLNVLTQRLDRISFDKLLGPVRQKIAGLLLRIDNGVINDLNAEIANLEVELESVDKLFPLRVEILRLNPSNAAAEVAQIDAAITQVVVQHDLSGVQAAISRASAFLLSSAPANAIATEALASAPQAAPSNTATNEWLASLTRGISILGGADTPPVGVVVNVVQPLLTILLIVLLTLYGVWLVYSGDTETAQTFGALGLSSYLSLFLWGLTAQVVAKTLQNISFSKS